MAAAVVSDSTLEEIRLLLVDLVAQAPGGGFSGSYAGTGIFDALQMDVANHDVNLAPLAAASLRLGAAPSATPVAQTLTIGEASRPTTDTNVGGASATIRSGLGTGTGTASTLIFQTPTVVASGSSVQTYATRMTISSAALDMPDSTLLRWGFPGGVYYPLISATGVNNSAVLSLSINSANWTLSQVGSRLCFTVPDASAMRWGTDLWIGRLGAASLQIGAANSAAPVANTLTIGESSRSGTDTNIAGASGTLQPGAGTGTGATTPLIFKAPIQVASGSGAQTQTEGIRVQAVATAIGISFYGVAAVARQLIATGSTTDQVITALQNLGLFRQS